MLMVLYTCLADRDELEGSERAAGPGGAAVAIPHRILLRREHDEQRHKLGARGGILWLRSPL